MSIGTIIATSAKVTTGYAKGLLNGIEPARAARMPDGVRSNHPAWILGHLSTYPDKILPMLDRQDLVRPIEEHYEGLFDHASECRDDADGSIYPAFADISERFFARHEAVIGALAETPDEVFAKANTLALEERFPTAGDLTNFLLTGHSMMHLGQLSAWRRCMGLGPAM